MQIKLNSLGTRNSSPAILVLGRKPFKWMPSTLPLNLLLSPARKGGQPQGWAFPPATEECSFLVQTGELPGRVNIPWCYSCECSIIELHMRILSFCYQGFSKDKIYILLREVYEGSVKYDNAASHAVLLGMRSGKCFPLIVSYNGWKYSLSLHTPCKVGGILLESGNLPLKYWHLKSKFKA